jgi:hypothetical protein
MKVLRNTILVLWFASVLGLGLLLGTRTASAQQCCDAGFYPQAQNYAHSCYTGTCCSPDLCEHDSCRSYFCSAGYES